MLLADPEFASQNRVSAITVRCFDAHGTVVREERVDFPPEPYCPTYEMLLTAVHKLNAQLGGKHL